MTPASAARVARRQRRDFAIDRERGLWVSDETGTLATMTVVSLPPSGDIQTDYDIMIAALSDLYAFIRRAGGRVYFDPNERWDPWRALMWRPSRGRPKRVAAHIRIKTMTLVTCVTPPAGVDAHLHGECRAAGLEHTNADAVSVRLSYLYAYFLRQHCAARDLTLNWDWSRGLPVMIKPYLYRRNCPQEKEEARARWLKYIFDPAHNIRPNVRGKKKFRLAVGWQAWRRTWRRKDRKQTITEDAEKADGVEDDHAAARTYDFPNLPTPAGGVGAYRLFLCARVGSKTERERRRPEGVRPKVVGGVWGDIIRIRGPPRSSADPSFLRQQIRDIPDGDVRGAYGAGYPADEMPVTGIQ